MTAEESALVRQVLTRPTDDTPRLVYADWLDEHGQADRAEFVRVQIRLLGMRLQGTPSVYHPDDPDAAEQYTRLVEREREMAKLFEWQGFQTAFGLPQHWPAWHLSAGRANWTAPPVPNWCGGVLRRGFVDEIRLPLSAFLDHARDLFSRHPITAVVLSDREPHFDQRERVPYAFHRLVRDDYSPGEALSPEELPPALYDQMAGDVRRGTLGWKGHMTLADSHAASSAACVAYGRKLAGLPPLE